MSPQPDQLCSYVYQYYGRSIYTQQVIRGSVALFTTIVSSANPSQRCDIFGSSVRGQAVIRHEYLPSRFGSCPDVLFIVCPEPCTFICNEDLVSFTSKNTTCFTTSQLAFYGARIIPLPPIDSPGEDAEPTMTLEPLRYPTSPNSGRGYSGPLFPPH